MTDTLHMSQGYSKTQKHILVVEDEEDILALIHYNLTREGFRSTCATSGEEALRLVQKDLPDLLGHEFVIDLETGVKFHGSLLLYYPVFPRLLPCGLKRFGKTGVSLKRPLDRNHMSSQCKEFRF